MAHEKRWSDLTTRQRTAIVVGGTLEVALTTVALVDLSRRPSGQVRGSKRWWTLACFIQPIGPIAYLLRGRKPPTADR